MKDLFPKLKNIYSHFLTRMGGMGIRNPIKTANNAYETLRTGTSVIVDAIKGKVPFSMLDHNNQFAKTISSMHSNI